MYFTSVFQYYFQNLVIKKALQLNYQRIKDIPEVQQHQQHHRCHGLPAGVRRTDRHNWLVYDSANYSLECVCMDLQQLQKDLRDPSHQADHGAPKGIQFNMHLVAVSQRLR